VVILQAAAAVVHVLVEPQVLEALVAVVVVL
jgi:hypothetical protein